MDTKFYHSGFILKHDVKDDARTFSLFYQNVTSIKVVDSGKILQIYGLGIPERGWAIDGSVAKIKSLYDSIQNGMTSFMQNPYRQVVDVILERVELVPGDK